MNTWPTIGPRPRRGFTLIELLVVITIIGMLTSVLLAAVYRAQENARTARTRSLISRLHNQVMSRWESYRTRRLPIDPSQGRDPVAVMATPASVTPISSGDGPSIALKGLYARRELMRREMPDQYQDLLIEGSLNGVLTPPASFNLGTATEPLFLVDDRTPATARLLVSSVHQAYARKIQGLVVPADTARDTVDEVADIVRVKNQGAECLYLILSTGMSDESFGRDQFHEGEVGDTDSDGMKEFIDAWGRPIEWFRWAPGFVSDVQPAAPVTTIDDPFAVPNRPPFQQLSSTPTIRRGTDSYDAMDSRRVAAFDLFPYCYPLVGRQPPFDNPPPAIPMNPALYMTSQNPPPFDSGQAVVTGPPDEPWQWGWGYRLTPLIVSAGPDRRFGLFFGKKTIVGPPGAGDALYRRKVADPYSLYDYRTVGNTGPTPDGFLPRGFVVFGEADPLTGDSSLDNVAGDNIHNHALSQR